MAPAFVGLVSSLLLLLQPDDLVLLQLVVVVALVVFGYLLAADANLLAYRLEGVALAGLQEVVLVVDMDRMEQRVLLMMTGIGGHELVVAFGMVVVVELVEFYQAYQLIGVIGIGGIAARLQPASPSLIVGLFQREETAVALVAHKESAVVFVALAGIAIGSEAFLRSIIVEIDRRSLPAMTLDAEVVVAALRQLAVAGTTLEDTLRQGDAGWYLVFQHLLDGQVAILVDIGLETGVPLHLLRLHE